MVERAQSGRGAAQRLAARVSAVFVPAVLLIALVTFGVWWWHSAGRSTASQPPSAC